jgi:hypothetical protein
MITTMPEGQSLYAPYTQVIPPVVYDDQAFAAPAVDVSGTDVLVPAVAKELATAILVTLYPTLVQSGRTYFTYRTTSAPSFSYTSTITTGTINFQFLVGGVVVQSITSTPSASPQTITFNAYTNIPQTSSNGLTTTPFRIQATATDAQSITETSITPLWVLGVRCVS